MTENPTLISAEKIGVPIPVPVSEIPPKQGIYLKSEFDEIEVGTGWYRIAYETEKRAQSRRDAIRGWAERRKLSSQTRTRGKYLYVRLDEKK